MRRGASCSSLSFDRRGRNLTRSIRGEDHPSVAVDQVELAEGADEALAGGAGAIEGSGHSTDDELAELGGGAVDREGDSPGEEEAAVVRLEEGSRM